ncbi:ankyrin repeat domain-containing protein [Diaphorobacter aerolatus]|uniref:Ankyrin repeat domain-containing protein n=1 Tax=Diaphorobacter aerolatus TaxID=1288495 RepID=A0A7H0GLC7_9BURK|nr:ankyrin repeat domain-containing protein [Diaphorobacter aerolatus]QNP49093.1 ankyrin repeat domain-containing protein [Diaphorobacter aerolatus]
MNYSQDPDHIIAYLKIVLFFIFLSTCGLVYADTSAIPAKTVVCPQIVTDSREFFKDIGEKPSLALDPFQLLMTKNHQEELEKRLNAGFPLSRCGGPFNASLLSTAAALGLDADVQLLLDKGADTETPLSPVGESALIFALANNRYSTSRLLLNSGASAGIHYGADNGGYTALSAISRSLKDARYRPDEELDIAKILLQKGVSPSTQDRNRNAGFTALHWTIISNKPALAHLLLTQGADPDLKDAKGRSSVDMAKRLKRTEIFDEILNSR